MFETPGLEGLSLSRPCARTGVDLFGDGVEEHVVCVTPRSCAMSSGGVEPYVSFDNESDDDSIPELVLADEYAALETSFDSSMTSSVDSAFDAYLDTYLGVVISGTLYADADVVKRRAQ